MKNEFYDGLVESAQARVGYLSAQRQHESWDFRVVAFDRKGLQRG